MQDPRHATRMRVLAALGSIVVLGSVAELASSSVVRKGAIALCFAVVLVLCLMPGKPKGSGDETGADEESPARQALSSRIAWALWMALSAGACFGIAELAVVITPALQAPFRVLGVALLLFGAYKLCFGRSGGNKGIDI